MSYNFTNWLVVNESSQLPSAQLEEWKEKIDTSMKSFAKKLLEKSQSIPGFLTDGQKSALQSVEASGLDDRYIIKFTIPHINLAKISFEAFSDATNSCLYGFKGGLKQGEDEYKPDIGGKMKRANVKMSAARLAKAKEERPFSAAKLSHVALEEFIKRIKSGTYEDFLDKLINYAGAGFKSYISGGHRNIVIRDKAAREAYAIKFGETTKKASELSDKLKNNQISQSDYESEMQKLRDEQTSAMGVSDTFEPADIENQENRQEYIASEYVKHYAGKPDLIYTLFNFMINCIRQSTLGNLRNKIYYGAPKSRDGSSDQDGEGEDMPGATGDDDFVRGGEVQSGGRKVHSTDLTIPDAPESGMSMSGRLEDSITNKSNSLLNILKRCMLVYLENSKNILSSKVSLNAKLAILKAGFCFRYLLQRMEKDTKDFVSDLATWIDKEMSLILQGKRPSVKAIINVNNLYDVFVANPEMELLRVAASICYASYDKVNSADALSMLPSNITKDMLVEAFGFDDYILFKEACDPANKFCIGGNTDHEKIIDLSDKIWLTSTWPNSQSIEFYSDNIKNVIFHAFNVWDARNKGEEGPPIEQCGKLAIKRKDVGFAYEHDPEHHKAVELRMSGGLTPEEQDSANNIISRLEKLVADRYYKRVLKERDPNKQKAEVSNFITPPTLSPFLRELLGQQEVPSKVSSEFGAKAKTAIQHIIKELMQFIIEYDKNNNPAYQRADNNDDDETPYIPDEDVRNIFGQRRITDIEHDKEKKR